MVACRCKTKQLLFMLWVDALQRKREGVIFLVLHNQWRCLSFFRIGCGLDRLQWENVSAMIEEVFETTDIRITVYILWIDEHVGCVHILLCHPCWALELSKLTLKWSEESFICGSMWHSLGLGLLYSHEWTGSLEEGLFGKCCCDFFSFFF